MTNILLIAIALASIFFRRQLRKIASFLGDLETHHQIFAFIMTFLLTMVITRLGVKVYDPSPTLLGFELHHFDYGLVLLMITTLMLLFSKQQNISHLIIPSGIAWGLILDEFWFIRGNLGLPTDNQILVYNASLPSAIIFTITIFLLIAIIRYARRVKK